MARGFLPVSVGADSHVMMVDVGARGISRRDAEKRPDAVGITVNKSAIAFDTRSPMAEPGSRSGLPRSRRVA